MGEREWFLPFLDSLFVGHCIWRSFRRRVEVISEWWVVGGFFLHCLQISIEVLPSPVFSTRDSLASLAATSFVSPSLSPSSSSSSSSRRARARRKCKGRNASACLDSARSGRLEGVFGPESHDDQVLSQPLLLAEFSEYRLPCCGVDLGTRFGFHRHRRDKEDFHSSFENTRPSPPAPHFGIEEGAAQPSGFSSFSPSSPSSCSCASASPSSSPSGAYSPPLAEESSLHKSYSNTTSTQTTASGDPAKASGLPETRPPACACPDSPVRERVPGAASNIFVIPGGHGLVTFQESGTSSYSAPSSLSFPGRTSSTSSGSETSVIVLTERPLSLPGGPRYTPPRRRHFDRQPGEGKEEEEEDEDEKERGKRASSSPQSGEDWWIGRVEVSRVSSISIRKRNMPPSPTREGDLYHHPYLSPRRQWTAPSILSDFRLPPTTIYMKRGKLQQFEIVLHDVYGRRILSPNDLR